MRNRIRSEGTKGRNFLTELRRMVHLVSHSGRQRTREYGKWCTWCAILGIGGPENEENGSCGVPFWPSEVPRMRKMAHTAYHFGHPRFREREEWCTWCTILAVVVPETRENGARSVPFWSSWVSRTRKMVCVVCRLGRSGARKSWNLTVPRGSCRFRIDGHC
jgi:hypothetical protein